MSGADCWRCRRRVVVAVDKFKAAHEIMGVPTTGAELCKAQVVAEQLVEALDTCLAVTRLPKGKREGRAFQRARSEAKTIAKEFSERIPALRISVTGSAAGFCSRPSMLMLARRTR